MKSVSRSLAAGKTSMPRDREEQQREDLGGGEPGLDRGLLAVAARHGRGLRGEGVDAVAVRRRVEPPLGEGEDGRPARPAGSCPAGTGRVRRPRSRPSPRCAPWWCRIRRPRGRRPRRRRRRGRRRTGTPGRSSGTCAARRPRPGPRRRRADDDQGGRQLRVLDLRRVDLRRSASAAVVHRLWTAVALTWPPPPRAGGPSSVRRTWSARPPG